MPDQLGNEELMQNTPFDDALRQLRLLQREFDAELDRILAEGQRRFRYTVQRGRVVFEQGMRSLHLQQRTGLWRYLRSTPLAFILTAPVIYGLAVPMVLLDLALMGFQQICFRVYGIPLVRRRDYLVIDRHRLSYLNQIEKLNCVYCAYANQLLEYAREIASRTEQFWCPIKHARRSPDAHQRTPYFVDYGDAGAYTNELESLRESLKAEGD